MRVGELYLYCLLGCAHFAESNNERQNKTHKEKTLYFS